MRFASYQVGKEEKLGIVRNDNLIDISSLYHDIFQVIEDGEKAFVKINDFISKQQLDVTQMEHTELLAPMKRAKRNIICVGWNYLEHFNERHNQNIELPESPTVFTKATNTITGPFSDIHVDSDYTNKLDYEAELAVIIAKRGKNIVKEEAEEYVFGYAVANDISARDVQFAHGGQWFLGKSMDESCPIGPYIVTKDEIDDVQRLEISCYVNGTRVQHSNTELMMFQVADIIAEISKGMTLESGDIILTGTPQGIGSKRNPPLFLQHNDIVTVEVEQIGQIKNKIKY